MTEEQAGPEIAPKITGPITGTVAYIGMGSNLGDRMAHLRSALDEMEARVGARVVASSAYETEPVGVTDQPAFMNAACRIETTLVPVELLDVLMDIEAAHGRVRTAPNGPRELDLDLLLYGDRVIDEPGLTVPHPRMGGRAFVLVPLAEIAADVVHPVTGLTVRRMLQGLPRPLGVGEPVSLRSSGP